MRVLALTGEFVEALNRAEALWSGWKRDGNPPMQWSASAVAAAAMVHGLCGNAQAQRLWRSRAQTMRAGSSDLAICIAFTDARVSVHCGQFGAAPVQVEQAFEASTEPWWVGYAAAAGAELAVVADLPDAAERVRAAERYAAENDWAAACLTRVRGRLGDNAALADAVEQWDRLGARFERAATLALIPGRAGEGRVELAALGCA